MFGKTDHIIYTFEDGNEIVLRLPISLLYIPNISYKSYTWLICEKNYGLMHNFCQIKEGDW